MYSFYLPFPYAPSLSVLSGNTFHVTTGNISVSHSPQTSIVIGSQAGNLVSVGGGWPFAR